MYITINNVIGEKRIDLTYPVQNFDSSKGVKVVGLLNDNIQYEFTAPWTIELESGNKWITSYALISQLQFCHPRCCKLTAGTYTRRKLIDLVEGKIELTQFDEEPRIKQNE